MSCDIICSDERQKRLLRMLFRKSGVKQRRTVIPWKTAYFWNDGGGPQCRGPGTGDRMAIYERYAPVLAAEACRQALGLKALEPIREATSSSESHADPLGGDGKIESSWGAACTKRHQVSPEQVTHLVTVSCTGFAAPGLDWALFDALGLCDTVQRVHVGFMGCHGAINGLRVAKGLAESDPNAVG